MAGLVSEMQTLQPETGCNVRTVCNEFSAPAGDCRRYGWMDGQCCIYRIRCFVVPPFLDLQRTSSDTSVKAGEDVELVCNATARPPATIEWTRLGGALLPIGQEKKLVRFPFLCYTLDFSALTLLVA